MLSLISFHAHSQGNSIFINQALAFVIEKIQQDPPKILYENYKVVLKVFNINLN
jgi:hypothetical protein